MTKVQAARGLIKPLHFDMRHVEALKQGPAAGRLAHLMTGLAFYLHAADAYKFKLDEQVIYDIKRLTSLEKQDPEEYSLGIVLSKMGRPMDVDDYPGLEASMVDRSGWGWLPMTAEEARRCCQALSTIGST